MEKYKLINWETVPLKKKLDWQLDRFVKVCVVEVREPEKVLAVIPLFGSAKMTGFNHLIELVHKYEQGIDKDIFGQLLEPIDGGEFVEVPSLHGDLFRRFSKDDARYGLCSKECVGKAERTLDGRVKIYKSIKVFAIRNIEEEKLLGKTTYVNGWSPQQWYYRYFGYNYFPIADLTEPLQI